VRAFSVAFMPALAMEMVCCSIASWIATCATRRTIFGFVFPTWGCRVVAAHREDAQRTNRRNNSRKTSLVQRCKSLRIVTLGLRVGDERANAAVSRRPTNFPLHDIAARSEGYTYAANVWDLSLAQGPVSVAPSPNLHVTIRIGVSSLHAIGGGLTWSLESILSNSSMQQMPLSASMSAPACSRGNERPVVPTATWFGS
jgi:hypothetical protein